MESTDSYKYTASICCMYKNESLHMVEWIEYHRAIGFQHFYLYNNRSDDDIPVKYKDDRLSDKTFREAVIEHYTNIGLLTHNEYTLNLSDVNFASAQNQPAYPFNHASRTYKHESKWIAYIDMDEFITINHENQNISDLLNTKFAHADGIYLNSVLFGSSGHYFEPKGLTIDNYRHHRPVLDEYIKAIYKPKVVLAYYGPHSIHHVPGSVAVNGSGIIITPKPILHGTVNPILVIHHHKARSLWYWLTFKLGRIFDKKSILDMERPKDWTEEKIKDLDTVEYKTNKQITIRAHYSDNFAQSWQKFNQFPFNNVKNNYMEPYVKLVLNAIDELPFYNISAIDFDPFAFNPIDESDKLSCWIDPEKYKSESILSFVEKSLPSPKITSIMKHYFLFNDKQDSIKECLTMDVVDVD